jgi:hypothetical protein
LRHGRSRALRRRRRSQPGEHDWCSVRRWRGQRRFDPRAQIGTEGLPFQTYKDGVFYQDPKITDEALNSLKEEEKFMAEAKLLKGTIDYGKWVDTSYLDAAYKELDANQ